MTHRFYKKNYIFHGKFNLIWNIVQIQIIKKQTVIEHCKSLQKKY